MKEFVVGIDIGGTNTVMGLVDREGNILSETSTKTANFPTAAACVEYLMNDALPNLLEDKTNKDIAAIGIGAPNGNYYQGTIEFAPNLSWKGKVALTSLFQKHIDKPVVLTNDANAAAIGEMLFGAAKGYDNFIEITIGTGLGSGIVVNGDILYGHDGFAGEIGHTIAQQGGRLCTCGRRGCLETYVSARGVMATLRELLQNPSANSPLNDVDLESNTPRDLYNAAVSGDPIAIEAFRFTGEVLGRQLADSVAHTSPNAIFVFGGVARAGDYLLAPTRKHLEENLLTIYQNKIAVLPSGLNGRNAAILGAGALAWKELDK